MKLFCLLSLNHKKMNKIFTKDQCVICMDTIGLENNAILSCGHKFHATCFAENVLNSNNSCPLCRRKITNLSLCKGCSLCGYFHFNNFKKNGNCIVCGKKSFQYILKNKLYEIEKS